MYRQMIPRSFLWLVNTVAILVIGITGCGGSESDADNNEWVGTWSLETIDGQSMEQNYSYFGDATIVTNTWRFNSDGFLEGEFAVKIAPKQVDSGELEIGSIKLTGTYFLSAPTIRSQTE